MHNYYQTKCHQPLAASLLQGRALGLRLCIVAQHVPRGCRAAGTECTRWQCQTLGKHPNTAFSKLGKHCCHNMSSKQLSSPDSCCHTPKKHAQQGTAVLATQLVMAAALCIITSVVVCKPQSPSIPKHASHKTLQAFQLGFELHIIFGLLLDC